MRKNISICHLQRYHCKKRIEYVHNDRSGLYVKVRATSPGRGTYYLRYKDANGKTCHQRIGRTHEMELSDAKEKAKKLRAEIAPGANPREEEKARKAAPTLSRFFDEQYLPYAKQRKRTWAKDEELFRLRLNKTFGHRRLI